MKFFKKKPQLMKPLEKKTHTWLYVKLIISLIVLGGLFYLFTLINAWFNTHYFEFKAPVAVNFYQPIAIRKRLPLIQRIVLQYPNEIDTPIKKYICDIFGTYDCKTALAIVDAESGFREEAIHINTNNTIDVGLFQINSVHFKQEGCSLKEVVDQYKNVDCAYSIFKASGWTPWTTFNNNSYLNNL